MSNSIQNNNPEKSTPVSDLQEIHYFSENLKKGKEVPLEKALSILERTISKIESEEIPVIDKTTKEIQSLQAHLKKSLKLEKESDRLEKMQSAFDRVISTKHIQIKD